jgi:hypothetical protein
MMRARALNSTSKVPPRTPARQFRPDDGRRNEYTKNAHSIPRTFNRTVLPVVKDSHSAANIPYLEFLVDLVCAEKAISLAIMLQCVPDRRLPLDLHSFDLDQNALNLFPRYSEDHKVGFISLHHLNRSFIAKVSHSLPRKFCFKHSDVRSRNRAVTSVFNMSAKLPASRLVQLHVGVIKHAHALPVIGTAGAFHFAPIGKIVRFKFDGGVVFHPIPSANRLD